MSVEYNNPSPFAPPVSSFAGPVAELIALRMLLPPSRPGLIACLDEYEIVRLLGTGGMGLVFLGRRAGSGGEVAIKMVRSEYVSNQEVVHRFLKEAGHLKRLRHSNIVPVEAVCDRPAGPYFVMPFFEKGSLANLIKPGVPLEYGALVDIATQVAAGLSFAHRSGIIHRDLKPANVLLAASSRACLADFGLARTLFNDTLVDVENRSHEGTAPYMSPAVAAGDAEDTRCDIYSFGAVLYEMLTGRPPYEGRGAREILNRIIAGPPRPVRELNPMADGRLVTVMESCMARELRDRYADMRDVLNDLERIKMEKDPTGHRRFKGGARSLLKPSWPRPELVIFIFLAVLAGWILGEHGHKVAKSASQLVAPATSASTAVMVTPTNSPAPVLVAANPPPVQRMVLMVSTVAGQAGVAGYTNGLGVQAKFRLPNSLVVDTSSGSAIVYVADTGNQSIRRIDSNGLVTTVAGMPHKHGSFDGAGTVARFYGPFGIAVDTSTGDAILYVADTGNNTIRKISSAGVVTTLAGEAGKPGNADAAWLSARFRNPWGVAVESDGDIVVADSSNDTIRKVLPSGTVFTAAGQAGSIGSVDGYGNNAQFNNPSAVAEDASGNLFISDSGNHVIRKITPSRVVSTFAGSAGNAGSVDGNGESARFWNPQGVAVDGVGNVYVADTGNNTIRKITPMGQVSTIAGLPGPGGFADGPGAQARFNGPAGIAVTKDGTIYVADTNNHVIRKVALTEATPH
jgi:serine/threonine protein kinase/sugar lactone lactonase YvrE